MKIHTPQEHFGQDLVFLIGRPRLHRNPRPPDASFAILSRVPWYRSFSASVDPVSARRASGLGFVAQPSNPTILWWTVANLACRLWSWAAILHRLMSMTLSCFSCHHAARTWSRSATESIEPSLLVSPLIGSPTRLRPFALCTNANQTATCTCNTRLRVNPHRVVNHVKWPSIGPPTLRSSLVKS
jgi:hypothetical protein